MPVFDGLWPGMTKSVRMPSYNSLPYRPCVGTMVLNRDGLVFIGRRTEGPEHVDLTHVWQMPQGGIDEGEDPWPAALRELHEETNISSVDKLDEVPDWLAYDLPPEVARQAWKGRYRGQTQKWFAFRFEGSDDEINVTRPGGGKHKSEFSEWRWERLDRAVELIVPYEGL